MEYKLEATIIGAGNELNGLMVGTNVEYEDWLANDLEMRLRETAGDVLESLHCEGSVLRPGTKPVLTCVAHAKYPSVLEKVRDRIVEALTDLFADAVETPI